MINLVNDDNEKKLVSLHRLIALTFIPNPDKKPFIDHIDRNRLNNRIDNLRWVTPFENSGNRGKDRTNKTGYKNISINKNGNYRIEIVRNGNRLFSRQFSKNKYSLDYVLNIRNEKYRDFDIEVTD